MLVKQETRIHTYQLHSLFIVNVAGRAWQGPYFYELRTFYAELHKKGDN